MRGEIGWAAAGRRCGWGIAWAASEGGGGSWGLHWELMGRCGEGSGACVRMEATRGECAWWGADCGGCVRGGGTVGAAQRGKGGGGGTPENGEEEEGLGGWGHGTGGGDHSGAIRGGKVSLGAVR